MNDIDKLRLENAVRNLQDPPLSPTEKERLKKALLDNTITNEDYQLIMKSIQEFHELNKHLKQA